MDTHLALEVIRIIARYLAGILISLGLSEGVAATLNDPGTQQAILGMVILIATELGWIKAKAAGK